MEKVVFVLWGPSAGEPAAAVAPALVRAGALDVVTHDVDAEGDARYAGPGPIDRTLGPFAGTVSFWVDCVDAVGRFAGVLPDGRTAHGYLVTESVPIRHPRTSGGGATTPGYTLLTVLDRPEGLAEDVFHHNWTRGHTPRVLAFVPLTGYVRNHVVRPLTAGAPRMAGIVTEQVAVLEDMVDRARWLGAADDPELARQREREQAEDVASFLDFSRLEAHCAIERRFA
jgi:hypothetical protein